MISEHIISLGLELEGGIDKMDLDKFEDFLKDNDLYDNYEYENDSSVSVDEKEIEDAELMFWHTDWDVIVKVVKFLFDECKFLQNRTCGNHVHFKVVDDEVVRALLTHQKVWDWFKDEYVKYASTRARSNKYFERLNNRYCLFKYSKRNVYGQYFGTNYDARYTAINQLSWWENKTFEIRLLPYAVNSKEYLDNLKWLVDTLEKMFKLNFIVDGEINVVVVNINQFLSNKFKLEVI
jgi:hypothetical protein